MDDLLTLSLRSTGLIREERVRAAMARQAEGSAIVIRDKTSVAIVDCGASSTLTASLINTSVEEKVSVIETADGDERMQSTHKCNKKYFVRNRMGEPVPISVPVLFIMGLPQDLQVIGGKSISDANIRVILVIFG